MIDNNDVRVFGLGASHAYAREVCRLLDLDLDLAPHTERSFEDDEIYVKSDANVRGKDVFVVSSLFSDNENSAGEKLTTLLLFLSSLKDASADRVTVICPYLSFARQDRKTESRASVSTKTVAKIIEAAGADRMVSIDVHNIAAYQNAFRIPNDHLEAKCLFVNELVRVHGHADTESFVVVSPDSGGMKRSADFQKTLSVNLNQDVGLAFVEKLRDVEGIRGGRIIGDVTDKNCVIVDDMIASGGTIRQAAEAIRSANGRLTAVCATHGLFIGEANENLRVANPKQLMIADTIPPFRLDEGVAKNLVVVPTCEMIAKTIKRIHYGGSISELLQD